MYLNADKRIFQLFLKEMVGTLPVVNSGVFKSANRLPQPILSWNLKITVQKRFFMKKNSKMATFY